MNKVIKAAVLTADTNGIAVAAKALREGRNVAFPTETVYGLGGNALDIEAVSRIFRYKGRPLTDPLIVHVTDKEAALGLVVLGQSALRIFNILADAFWPGPLTLVMPANLDIIPNMVCAGTGLVGVRVPSHPIAHQLLREAQVPVAAPSANRFGHVSPTSAQHVLDDLGEHDLYVLDGGDCKQGACMIGIESTVLHITETDELVLFRKGGVSEASIMEALRNQQLSNVRIVPPQSRVVAEETAAAAPGQLLTHYAPDVDTWLIQSSSFHANAKHVGLGDVQVPLRSCAIIDYHGALKSLEPDVGAYRDLSEEGSLDVAAQRLFDTLRWVENVKVEHVLIQDVSFLCPQASSAPALTDRMYRAASGKVLENAVFSL